MSNILAYCEKYFSYLALTRQVRGGARSRLQEDIDIHCLRVSVQRFLKNATRENAFDVYFCFNEIFRLFGDGYRDNTFTLSELLSSYEFSTGAVVDKLRDHYVHSVYVFLIGISIYTQNKTARSTFDSLCCDSKKNAIEEFLYRWGIVALFHDVGYPFELAFIQIRSYSDELKKIVPSKALPMVSFRNIEGFNNPVADLSGLLKEWDGQNLTDILALDLEQKIGAPKGYFENLLKNHISEADRHMDHGYFSAITMASLLLGRSSDSIQASVNLDACSAILLHNGVMRKLTFDNFKGAFTEAEGLFYKKKMPLKGHPYGYLLLLCDCIQDYGRACYGKNNKNIKYPYDCRFIIEDSSISIHYVFDDDSIDKVEEYKAKLDNLGFFLEWGDLFDEVHKDVSIIKDRFHARCTLSDGLFNNLMEIAIKIHSNYLKSERYDIIIDEWDKLTLEYKLSNIQQAKAYTEKLESINCFYTKRNLKFQRVDNFDNIVMKNAAKIEHERWMQEKLEMGWHYGTDYTSLEEREQKRIHKCLVPFEELEPNSQGKDYDVFYGMLKNLKELGYKVYKTDECACTDFFYVGVAGHINLLDVHKAYSHLETALASLKQTYGDRLILLSACADGTDLISSEIAIKLKIKVKVILPRKQEDFRREIIDRLKFDQVRAYADEIIELPPIDPEVYVNTGRYIAENCDMLIAVWNGESIQKPGGTYHVINMAKKFGKEIIIIPDGDSSIPEEYEKNSYYKKFT